MLQRFTIDILANHIADQLLTGEPSARLGYRFFRKGRRDGRKNFDHESVGRLLREAVRLAADKLADEMAWRRSQIRDEIAALESSIRHRDPGSASEPLAPPVPDPSDRENVRGPSLNRALLVRAEALVKASEVAQEAARKTAEEAVGQAQDELERQRMALEGLPAVFGPRALGIVHSGQVLWTRYCNGFVQGDTRRRKRRRYKPVDGEIKPPDHDVMFALPPEFNVQLPSGEVTAR
jgi:hypothetical protein